MDVNFSIDAKVAVWLAVIATSIAATTLLLFAWTRLLSPISDWLEQVEQKRLALYFRSFVANVGIASVILAALVLARQIDGEQHFDKWLIAIRLQGEASVLQIAAVTGLLIPVFYGIGAASAWVSNLIGEKPTDLALLIRPHTPLERLVWVTVASPSAGFFEEILYRGFWLWLLTDWTGDPVIAVALSSLVFGVEHFAYGLVWTIGSTFMGVAAAIGVLLCDSLWPAIIAHTLYNMTVYYIFDRSSESNEERVQPAGHLLAKRSSASFRIERSKDPDN